MQTLNLKGANAGAALSPQPVIRQGSDLRQQVSSPFTTSIRGFQGPADLARLNVAGGMAQQPMAASPMMQQPMAQQQMMYPPQPMVLVPYDDGQSDPPPPRQKSFFKPTSHLSTLCCIYACPCLLVLLGLVLLLAGGAYRLDDYYVACGSKDDR